MSTEIPSVELTTRSDFIELQCKDITYAGDELEDWKVLHVNRRHIAWVDEQEQRMLYGLGQSALALIHPDSVQDLLKFIKEG